MKMNNQRAVEILQEQIADGNCTEEVKEAMKVAVVAIEELDAIEGLYKARNTVAKDDVSCEYLSDGRCVGQKGMPECTPNFGYCPLVCKNR